MGQGPAECTELMHNVQETSTQIKFTKCATTSRKYNDGVSITTFQPNTTIVFLFINLLCKFLQIFFFIFHSKTKFPQNVHERISYYCYVECRWSKYNQNKQFRKCVYLFVADMSITYNIVCGIQFVNCNCYSLFVSQKIASKNERLKESYLYLKINVFVCV